MARKKPIISPLGQWAYPGEVTVIPSSKITMKGVNYPVLGVDDLGNSKVMMPGAEYDFPGNYVTEYPQMNKGGQMIKRKDGSYSKRGLWDNIRANKGSGKKPTKEMLEQERKIKAKMQNGGWLDQYQVGAQVPFSDSANYSYDKDGNLVYTNYPFGFTYNGGINLFINDRLNHGTEKPLNNYEIDFLENAKKKIENLDIYPQHFDFQVSTQVDKLNPSLEELIKVTQNTYPDQYAIDNSFSKTSRSDSKINLPPSAFENDIKERYVIPNALKNSINKSFGTLPTTQEEGYSPNRIWTTKVKDNERSGVGAAFTKPGDYAYILTPNSKKTSGFSKEKINTKKENIENSLSSIDNKFYEDIYEKYPDYIQYPGNYNNPEISLFGDIKNRLPNQMWNRAEQMRVEMLNNPEIKDWADLHNLNLSKQTKDSKQNLVIDDFAPKVPESVYANRLVKAGLPVSTPDYNYGKNETYIAQDPSKFNLAGYFSIPEGYSDENAQELIAKKLGIKQEQLNSKDYLIHYNKSPITEYTPGKKYGGWLEQYQSGGLLSKDDYDLTIAPKRGDYLLPDINRPYYIDDAGERRTEYKIGINVDGKETLIPTVVGGKQLTEDEARDRYRKTGLHMGQFNTPEEADYAARLRTARYKMLEDPINFQANQFQVGGTLPPRYTSNPRKVQLYQDSLNLYNKYQPSFDKYKNWTRLNNIQTASLQGNDLFNQYWGPNKPKGPSPYNENIIIKPVEEMMHHYLRPRSGVVGGFTHLYEKPGNNYLETKISDYLTPNPKQTYHHRATRPDGQWLPYNVGLTAAQIKNNAARKNRMWPVSVTKEDFLDLGLTGVTPDLNSVFRFKKPVQPYVYKKPEVVPDVVNTPVVEPPKPSLFVSNIDRDMYTPNGGMAREYNIGVTLQDGSKKAFRTEKEYQDWKAANNLDISKAKVSEGRGYSYNYPENKKYGGWLNKYQEAGEVPSDIERMQGVDIRKKRSWSDKLRGYVISGPDLNNRKAAEAAQYARRSEKNGDTFIKYAKSQINPYNWGVTDYTKSGTRAQAFSAARKAGEKEFMWNDERYNTRKDTDPIKYTGDNPNQEEYDKILRTQYPEFYKILNRGQNVGNISFEGVTDYNSDRAFTMKYPNFVSTGNSKIGVGKNPLSSQEFISNLIAETAHVKDKNLDINIFNPYLWKFGSDFLKLGDTIYDTPGTAEYNAHRLIEPGIAMLAYGNLSPNDIKRIQKNLGVKEDGYFGETTYKALQNKYKDNEYIQEAIENNQILHQNLDNNPIFSRDTEIAKRYLRELNKEVPLKYYDKFKDFRKVTPPIDLEDIEYVPEIDTHTLKVSDYTDAALLSTSGDNMNALLLQQALRKRGYNLPKSTTKYGDLDGKYGDETKNALLDWQNKNITKKQNGGWLNSYQIGGAETSTEQNPDRMQGVDIRKKRSWSDKLRGYVNQFEKKIGLDPYNERSDDFMEQWARRVNTATGGRDWYKQANDGSGTGGIGTAMMETVMAPFSAPQLASVYGATGKVQRPSEALNIQNPVGAFLTDAVLDPVTYIAPTLRTGERLLNATEKAIPQAVSYASKLAKSQIIKNPRLALSLQRSRPVSLDNVNTISGIRYGDIPFFSNNVSENNFFKQLEKGSKSLDNSINKRVADLESEEGFRRLVEQEKAYLFDNTDTDLSVIDRIAKLNAKARIEELKNITNINKQAAEYANTNYLGSGKPNKFVSNSDLYNNAYYQKASLYDQSVKSSGTLNLKKPTPNYSKAFPGEIGMGYNYVGNVPIEMHEIGHALQRGRILSLDNGLKNIVPKKELNPINQRNYKYFKKGSSGAEPTAFANELREAMFQKGFIPDYYTPINQKQIQDAYKYFKKNPMGSYDKNTGSFASSTRIFDFMEPNKANSKLLTDVLNRLPAVAPLGVGAVAASQLQEQKKGGQTSWLNKYK